MADMYPPQVYPPKHPLRRHLGPDVPIHPSPMNRHTSVLILLSYNSLVGGQNLQSKDAIQVSLQLEIRVLTIVLCEKLELIPK